MTESGKRPLAMITGGSGGMGTACTRKFAAFYDVILVDISADRLAATVETLEREGTHVAGIVAGDLASDGTLDEIKVVLSEWGLLNVLVHTAGTSSAMADWQTIIRTNVEATARLLDLSAGFLGPGSVAILVASIAGHLTRPDREIDALIEGPVTADFYPELESALTRLANGGNKHAFTYSSLSGPAYGVSKRAVIRMAAMRSAEWAAKGARIVSISPGMIDTPMGRLEVERGEAARSVLEQTPLARWGLPTDIAEAAWFLASRHASFITGTDLRIDGGFTPLRLGDECW